MIAIVSAAAEADLDALVGARHHDPFGVCDPVCVATANAGRRA